MEENKQGRITAQNAVSNAENLQENEKVSNFALQGFMDPRTDFGFKKIFGSKKVMLPFLNDVLDMGSPIEDIEFLTTEMTPEHKEERNVFYDLRCRTADGMEFLVEMQRADQTYFRERMIYYLARSIASQGYAGKIDNKKWDYRLNPVVGIFILDHHLSVVTHRLFRKIGLYIENPFEKFIDFPCVFTIELPCIEGKTPEECTNNIERWAYNFYNMSKMTTNSSLPFEDQMPVFKDVAELAKLCALDRDQYLLYMDAVDRYRASVAVYNEQYEKGMTDGLADGMAKGMAKGMAEGMAKGRAEGRAEGLQEGMEKGKTEGRAEGLQEGMEKGKLKERYNNAKALKENGIPVAIISVSLGLSVEEVEKL